MPRSRRGGRLAGAVALGLAVAIVITGCAGDDGGAAAIDPGEAASPSFDVARMIGLDGDQVGQLLGPADFKRADGPAEMLQYRGAGCVLDVYLYRGGNDGDFRVTYVEARDRQLARVPPQTCIGSVIRAKRSGGAG